MKTKYINLITEAIPETPIQKIEVIKSGFNSDAVIVNDEWVFRFPKREEVCEEYIHEEYILNQIAKHIDIPVPIPQIFRIRNNLFTKHKIIRGEQYTFAAETMSEAQKERLAYDLAKFLFQLHSIKIDLPIKQSSLDDFPCIKADTVLPNTFALEIRNTLDIFAEKTNALNLENVVLCHTDMNENNILVENGKLCGIIDFGDVSMCDRSVDFAALTKFDYLLAEKMAKYYAEISGKIVDFDYAILIEKMICYNGIVGNYENPKVLDRYLRWLSRIIHKKVKK